MKYINGSWRCFHDDDRVCVNPLAGPYCGGMPAKHTNKYHPHWVVFSMLTDPEPASVEQPTQQLSLFDPPRLVKKWRSVPSAYQVEEVTTGEVLYDKRQWWVGQWFCEWGANRQAWKDKFLLNSPVIQVVMVVRPKKRGRIIYEDVTEFTCAA